jgi:hypothetical protein
VKKTGEPYTWGIDGDALGALVEKHGLRLASNLGPDQVATAYLPKRKKPLADHMGLAHAVRGLSDRRATR